MKFLLIFLAGIGIVSCSPKVSPDQAWADQRWVLSELSGVPVQISGTDKDAHLVFFPKEKGYAGTGGCNRLRGVYVVSGKKEIRFNNPAATMMACADSKFEDRFLQVLATVREYATTEKELLLGDGKGVVMRFVPMGKP